MSIVWWPIKTKIRTHSIRGSFVPFFFCPPPGKKKTSAEDTKQTWKPRRSTPFPPHKKKIFPNVHDLLSFKDVISWTNIFLASCHQSVIPRLFDGISVLLLLCLWVKCTQSRCQREKAANANARRRTRGTRCRHAWRDKVHSAHLLLTDSRSTAYPVGNTLYWFLFLRSYFVDW